jgi:signal transduction histidine kinase
LSGDSDGSASPPGVDPARALADDSGRGGRAIDAWLAVGRALAQQHVLAGIVHDLNGRLNNLILTVTLLDTTLARHAAPAPVEPLLERCRRYGSTLASEAKRLTEALRPLAAMVVPEVSGGDGTDVARLLDEIRAALRHAAVLGEIGLAASVRDTTLRAHGDVALLRVALLDIATGLMACTPPGGDIAIGAHAEGDDVVVRFTASGARIPAAALRAFDRVPATAAPGALELMAARAIVAAQGGQVELETHAEGAVVETRFAR